MAYYILDLYFKDLEKGFRGQQDAMVKIETALNLFSPGFFLNDEEKLYSDDWQKAGKKSGEGKYFIRSYWLLLYGIITLITSVLIKTCFYC